MPKHFTGSIVLLIILILICWPAGLIYFFMKYEEVPMTPVPMYAAPPPGYGAPPPVYGPPPPQYGPPPGQYPPGQYPPR